ncbi:adenosine deaminase [Streptomyces sp. JJ36]|uniref:adenosine deaminase family protein n=1 Tax=Streptomyces sp. JJ36 TaxID=2736645 RepID=UPI001F302B0C|nr:adenosine deaminase [Streptomyces sp. JJ36]MCF6523486.1 adenosine deaminase [Streptomyces sp. JJ36]
MNTTRPPHPRRRRLLPLGLTAAVLCLLPALPAAAEPASPPVRPAPEHPAPTRAERAADTYLDRVRERPGRLRAFFRALPKGGDLHNHLSGAASTETLIRLAGQEGLCVETDTMKAVPPPCGPGNRPAADARTDGAFRRELIRAWSMEDLPRGASGHDHFFATFGKFGEVPWRRPGALLADVTDTMARQNQFYLESMTTPASPEGKKLAQRVGFDRDLRQMHAKLVAGGKLDQLVRRAQQEADKAERQFREISRCGTPAAAPGCRVTVRWISQAARASTPERVFTQLALGMRLAERDPRFVAVNLVQPEDDENALRHYRLHMRMLDYLHGVYPDAHITLHAGELVPGLAKPEDLRFHIREAVRTGHAERIGHGVDLLHEDGWRPLLREMARRGVAVEVPFTSNRQILGVSGDAHPFPVYRRHGVPVVLATDDPGVSRTDISREYAYAARTYGLDYVELKNLARASLEHAFLPGRSLWRTGGPDAYVPRATCAGQRPGTVAPRAACAELLRDSAKARHQWRLEAAFHRFEQRLLRTMR